MLRFQNPPSSIFQEAPVNEQHLPVSQKGPYGYRCSVSRVNGLFIHSHLWESPVKELFQETGGGGDGNRPRSPKRKEGLYTMGCGLVPQKDRLRHSYHYPRAMQPLSRYLPPCYGWARAPLASLCLSKPLRGVPSTPVLLSRDPGYGST
jgi:hypothetical protein